MAADVFESAVVTDLGLALQAKMMAGKTINFTKVRTGAGYVTPVLLTKQINVTNVRQEFIYNADAMYNGEPGEVTLPIVINNINLSTGYDLYQIGIFAEDPDFGEILYCIIQSEKSIPVPAYKDMNSYIAEFHISVQYGNADSVTVIVDPAGILTIPIADERYADKDFVADFVDNTTKELAKKALATDLAAHTGNKSNPHGVTKAQVGLGNADNTADSAKNVASAAKLTTARTIDGVSFNGTAAITHFGTCSTAAATAAKTVACTGFTLATGAKITVLFTATNTAANATLNVNGTGAKGIFYDNLTVSPGYLKENRTYNFVYDGERYQLIGDINTHIVTGVKGNAESTYRTGNVNITPANIGAATSVDFTAHTGNKSNPHAVTKAQVGLGNADNTADSAKNVASAEKLTTARTIDGVSFNGTAAITHFGTCATAAATVAKTVACTGFTLVTGAEITVQFTVTNTAANPTLNVNGTGAKSIYYRNAAISAGNLVANRIYRFVYDGAQYELIGDINTNTTYSVVTTSANGLMSKEDKVKLDGVETGAQKNTVTGIKGNAESTYRTGNVNITPANIGAATSADFTTHTGNKSNPHAVTKAQVGLGSVDNTADSAKTVAKAAQLTTARTIDGVSFNGAAAITHFATCSTAAATAAKTVTCAGFTLVTGAEITVQFTVTNTAANPTLNVNSTGAKPIYYRNVAISAGYLAVNRTYRFVYDGAQYELIGDINTDTNTTYSNMTAATASAAGKAGLVPAPAAGKQAQYLRGDGTWATPTNTTYGVATESANGLMSKEDKAKLNKVDYTIGVDEIGLYIEF